MAKIEPDNVMGREAGTDEDEPVLAEWRADPGIYWKNHLILMAVFGVAAGLVLLWTGNPYPWAGPMAAILAVGIRAAYLRSEALSDRWRLTPRRLIGPGGRIIPLSAIREVRPLFGDVLIITLAGDKHLMKYMADAPGVISRIRAAR
jgi:hypothetical protein